MPTDPLIIMAELGPVIRPDGDWPSGHIVTRAENDVRRIRKDLEEFREKAREIQGDPAFSQQGKTQRLVEIGEAALNDLGRFDVSLRHYQGQRDELAESLKVDKAPDDSAAHAVREREVRDRLLQMEDPERVGVFLDAVESGDELVFQSIVNAPKFLGMIPKEIQKQGKADWAEKRDPESVAELRAMNESLEQLEKNLASAKRLIRKEAGLPAPEPVFF